MADDPDSPGALPGAIGGISGASLAPALTDWLNYLTCPSTTADQLSCLPQRLQSANGILISFLVGAVGALLTHWFAGWTKRAAARRSLRMMTARVVAGRAAVAAERSAKGDTTQPDRPGPLEPMKKP